VVVVVVACGGSRFIGVQSKTQCMLCLFKRWDFKVTPQTPHVIAVAAGLLPHTIGSGRSEKHQQWSEMDFEH